MSETYKTLYRSQDDRMVAGVCAGLGEYFNIRVSPKSRPREGKNKVIKQLLNN